VYERNFVKELGKKAAVPSVYGLPRFGGAAAKDLKRLFTKNTGSCEAAMQCIGADAWPVSER